MRQAQNQAALLHGVSSTNGRPKEVTNHTLSALLRVLIKKNMKEWEECLPIAEFAYNRARHSTTGKSPFEVVYRFNPLSPLDILPLPLQERINLHASACVTHLKKVHEDTRHTIQRGFQHWRPSSTSTSNTWCSTSEILCGYTFARTASPTNASPNYDHERTDPSRCLHATMTTLTRSTSPATSTT